MASVLKLLPLFFLVTIIFSSVHQTQARDSQFFSKVSRENPDNIYNDNNNVVQDTKLPNDVKDVDVTKSQDAEQEPTFLPQTNQHGYGLYGHETTQKFPPSTATTQTPYTTTATQTPYTTTTKTAEYEEPTSYGNKDNKAYSVNNNNNYAYNYGQDNNKEQGMKTGEELQQQRSGYFYTSNDEGENNKKKNNYADELHGLDETTLIGSGYTTAREQQNGAVNSKNFGYNNGVEKTGMSDTRYLENGRYFHDINSEKMNQPKTYNTNGGDEQYNTNDRYNGYYYGKNNGDDNLNGYNDHQFNGINTNSQYQGNDNMAYQYKSNQGNNMAYQYNKYNQGNTMAYDGRYNNNNNMGYQYKANYNNNKDQDDFEFDP